MNNIYWGWLGGLGGPDCGIGDFISQLPGIDYYSLDLESQLYFEIANAKFECLVPKRKNIFIVKDKLQHPNTIIPNHTNWNNHCTAVWLPQIEKFKGNWSQKKENFAYPYLPIDLNLRNHLLFKLNLNDKKFITLNKIAYHAQRNWNEEGWNYLIKLLHNLNYSIVNIGLKNSLKNSIQYTLNENVIDIEDFNLDLNEIGHVMSASEACISVNSGLFHLATTFQTKHVIVISNMNLPDCPFWMYPNTKELNMEDPIESIGNNILDILSK